MCTVCQKVVCIVLHGLVCIFSNLTHRRGIALFRRILIARRHVANHPPTHTHAHTHAHAHARAHTPARHRALSTHPDRAALLCCRCARAVLSCRLKIRKQLAYFSTCHIRLLQGGLLRIFSRCCSECLRVCV